MADNQHDKAPKADSTEKELSPEERYAKLLAELKSKFRKVKPPRSVTVIFKP